MRMGSVISKLTAPRTAIVTLVVAAIALTACSGEERGIAFDGVYFKTKTKTVDKKNLSVFTTSISPVSASVQGALAAARHQGTTYCIQNFGTSRIDWTNSPYAEPETLAVVDDTLTFQGTCRP